MNIIENTNLNEKLPQVRVTKETKRKIVKLAGEEQERTGDIVRISDVIRRLIEKGLTTK